ncbi:hypothetical protein IFO70_32540 [Phormidium tenue FACHB-886]|nr:hypothetical protein [Phormidium tenue FACHB-886]
MSHDPAPITPASCQGTLGDRIRNIADQLKQESSVQIKATSRILGAAAKLSENHDRLIDEVVDMVEADLDQQAQAQAAAEPHTVEQLKQQFRSLSSAKTHFGVKVASWAALARKLNDQTDGFKQSRTDEPKDSVPSRLDAIEQEIKSMRTDMEQVLKLLDIILKKL